MPRRVEAVLQYFIALVPKVGDTDPLGAVRNSRGW